VILTQKDVDEFVKGVRAMRTEYVDAMNAQFGSGIAPWLTNIKGPLDKLNFETEAAKDPNWVLMLPYVDGGEKVVRDYMKESGVDPKTDWKAFAKQTAVLWWTQQQGGRP